MSRKNRNGKEAPPLQDDVHDIFEERPDRRAAERRLLHLDADDENVARHRHHELIAEILSDRRRQFHESRPGDVEDEDSDDGCYSEDESINEEGNKLLHIKWSFPLYFVIIVAISFFLTILTR